MYCKQRIEKTGKHASGTCVAICAIVGWCRGCKAKALRKLMKKNSAWKWASAEEVKADFDAYTAEVGNVGCIAFRCGSLSPLSGVVLYSQPSDRICSGLASCMQAA
jgi:hypothetical protein